MIISEKQIMQLIFTSKAYVSYLLKTEDNLNCLEAEAINNFLFTIAHQQSEELKEVN